MKRPVWLVAGVALLVLVGWLIFRPGSDEQVAVDLIEQWPNADPAQKRPSPEAFAVVDTTIAGVTKPSILIKDVTASRAIWTVTVPENGELRVSLGLQEPAWTVEGDGVLFRVLVAAGGPPEEILNLLINPYGNPSDRMWHDIQLDLSEYAGEQISVFFNTNSSPPLRPPVDNRNGDLAVWGNPRIVAR